MWCIFLISATKRRFYAFLATAKYPVREVRLGNRGFEKVLTQTVIGDKRQMGRKWERIVTFGAEPYVRGLKDMTELFLVLYYSDI